MLTNFWKAARALIAIILPAVFFSAVSFARDSSLNSLEISLNDLILDLSRSVVTVEASQKAQRQLGTPGDETYTSIVSSGIVVDSFGHVLVTARPVVGKDHITVRFDDRAVPARLVAVDYQNEIALLECPDAVGAGLPVTFSERQACAGQMIITMGHTYGVRAAPALGFCAGIRSDGAMQFSVQTAPTAVGGGVFDLSGRMLGMITGRMGANHAVTLALPAHSLPNMIYYLSHQGDRHSGFVGITTQEVEISPPIPIPYNASLASYGDRTLDAIERGLLVTSTVPNSPAQRAGLMRGDLIFAVNSMPVNSAAGLSGFVKQSLPGTKLEVELLRRDRFETVSLVVARKSLNLAPGVEEPDYSGDQEVDSLRQAVEYMKRQLDFLERRLDELD